MKISDLTAQLQQESNQTAEQIKQIENDALSKFEADLQQRCSTAATTLKSGLGTVEIELKTSIRAYKTTVQSAIMKDANELTEQLATVKEAVKVWVPSLLKIVKWAVIAPILATFLLCLAGIGGSLLWWKIEDRERVHMKSATTVAGDQMRMVDEPSWEYCNEQTITDKSGKKIVTRERCRKVE